MKKEEPANLCIFCGRNFLKRSPGQDVKDKYFIEQCAYCPRKHVVTGGR